MEFQEYLQQGYYNSFLLNTAYTGWRTMYYISFWSLRRVCIYLISRKYFSTIVTSIHVVPHIEPQNAKPIATRGYLLLWEVDSIMFTFTDIGSIPWTVFIEYVIDGLL